MHRKERRINARIGFHKRHRGTLCSEQLEPRLLLTTLQADSLGEPAYDQEIQTSAYYAAVSPNGTEGDGQTSIIYDAGTGSFAVDAPSGVDLSSIDIESTSGVFTREPAENLGGAFDVDNDTNIFKAIFGGSFGSLSFGNVAPPLLEEAFLLEDLTVRGTLANAGMLRNVDLIYLRPGLLPNGQIGDDQTSIIYHAGTGKLEVDAPSQRELSGINIVSSSGIFTGDPADNLGGPFDIDNDTTIFKATFDGSFSSISFGNVAQPVLSEAFLANDLTVIGTRAGGGELGDVDLIYVCPELCPKGHVGDEKMSIVYHAGTGDIEVDPPSGVDLSSVNIVSAAGIFTGRGAENLGGPFDIDNDTTIFKATFDSTFGPLSFGSVAQPLLDEAFLISDLTVIGTVAGGGGLGEVDLVYIASRLFPGGVIGDNQTTIIYDAGTGRLEVDAPSDAGLTSLIIESAEGIFTGSPADNLGGAFDIDSDTTIFKATFDETFGSLNFGNVAQPGLDEAFMLSDLGVTGSLSDGGDLGDVDFIYLFTNFLPTITSIVDWTVAEDMPTRKLVFTVGDLETPDGLLNVSGTSSNTDLVPHGNIVVMGANANRTVTVTPAADQFGTATITMTVRDADGGSSTSSFVLGVTPVNDAPIVTSIATRRIDEDTSTAALPLTIGDAETPAEALIVRLTSSNTALVPNENIIVAGSGANRTVTITPTPNRSGNTEIELTVTDADGASTAEDFDLIVNPVNDATTISSIATQTTDENISIDSIPFTVSDVESAVGTLSVSGTSSNTALVPNSNISIVGSDANRTVSITPALNQWGQSTITLIVRDPQGGSATETFLVTVNLINALPTISKIADQSTLQDTPTGIIQFTVGDLEDSAGDLTVSGSSSSAVVPNGNIVFGGSGANRTLTMTPAAGQTGTAIISVMVQDLDGGTATHRFVLQVGAFVPLAGDANGDREFNQIDLVFVLQAAKYLTGEQANFEEGDFNRDGIFDPRDIVAALQTGNYLQGPYAADPE